MLGFHLDPSPFFCRSEALSRAVGRCWVGRSIVEEFGRPVLEPEADPTEPKRGWQHRAARCLEERHLRRQVGPTLTDPTRALALTARATPIDPQPFRVWLCRRLFLPLPLAYAFAPSLFHAADVAAYSMALGCWVAEVCLWSGRLLKCAGREADVWVWTGSSVIRMWELFNPLDGRRIEVIVDGLSLWHRAQLAVDSTVVSHLHGDGTARRHAATTSGVALQAARRAKETTFPELSGEGG